MERQFTSTVFILEGSKVLFIHHAKIERWMPPGGHVEENETPAETALREVMEETGLEVELVSKPNFEASHPKVSSVPLPYMCQLEKALGDPNHPHQHIDFIYVAKPSGGKLNDGRWFSAEEIEGLCEKSEILPDVQEIALHLLRETV